MTPDEAGLRIHAVAKVLDQAASRLLGNAFHLPQWRAEYSQYLRTQAANLMTIADELDPPKPEPITGTLHDEECRLILRVPAGDLMVMTPWMLIYIRGLYDMTARPPSTAELLLRVGHNEFRIERPITDEMHD